LGTPHPGRRRLRRPYPVLLDQPGETRVCRAPRRLAIFIRASRNPFGKIPVGCAFCAPSDGAEIGAIANTRLQSSVWGEWGMAGRVRILRAIEGANIGARGNVIFASQRF